MEKFNFWEIEQPAKDGKYKQAFCKLFPKICLAIADNKPADPCSDPTAVAL